MAFVSFTPGRLAIDTKSSSTSLVSRRKPLRSTPSSSPVCIPIRMSESSEEEVSVPISSLKDLNEKIADSQSATPSTEPESIVEEDDDRTEAQKEADRLRAAEKFISVDEGNYECLACSYVYEPAKGEKQSNIPPGTDFEDLPDYYVCPVCRSPKSRFVSKKKVIAGFADNQKYGLGSNSLTGGQKNGLIFGGLAFFFLLLLSGYALN